MIIKTNENKNRINLPVPMGANQKIGVFFSKQQKTKQLESQNATLQQKINQALIKFQQQNQYLKQLKVKNNATTALLGVLTLQNQTLQNSNKKDNTKIKQLEEQKLILKEKQQKFTTKLIEYQKQLFQNTKKHEQKLNLLQRYEYQIKNQKSLRYAPDSIVNVVISLEKELQLLQRNICIHENKLEGKKKYLNLLQKKEQAQTEKDLKLKKQQIKSPKKMLNIYQKSYGHVLSPRKSQNNTKIGFKSKQLESQQKVIKQDKRQTLKKFNQINRKKNAIMLQGRKNL